MRFPDECYARALPLGVGPRARARGRCRGCSEDLIADYSLSVVGDNRGHGTCARDRTHVVAAHRAGARCHLFRARADQRISQCRVPEFLDGVLRRTGGTARACRPRACARARAAQAAPLEGRPLFAANRALPEAVDPIARLWHFATLLREHRGDGHVATLLSGGVTGRQSHVLQSLAMGMPKPVYVAAREFSDDEWSDVLAELHTAPPPNTARSRFGKQTVATRAGELIYAGIARSVDNPWVYRIDDAARVSVGHAAWSAPTCRSAPRAPIRARVWRLKCCGGLRVMCAIFTDAWSARCGLVSRARGLGGLEPRVQGCGS